MTWNEDGSANVADPVEVKQAFVPLDFVSPFEKNEASEQAAEAMAAVTREKEALAQQVADLQAEVERLKAAPAAEPAHEQFTGAGARVDMGSKGLNNLSRIASAR